MRWPDARRLKRWVLIALASLCGAAIVGTRVLGFWAWETHHGYFDPAVSPDGRYVFAVERWTNGFTAGMPLAIFAPPPVHAWAIQDRLRLIRIDISTARTETLVSWPSTPIRGRFIEDTRGHAFGTLHAGLRPDGAGTVPYTIDLTLPGAAYSEVHFVTGTWAPTAASPAGWQRGTWAGAGASEPVVVGDLEVFAAPGFESYPSAIVLLDHRTMTVRPLLFGGAYRAKYPHGVPIAELLPVSQKAHVDRLAAFKTKEEEFIAAHRAEGMAELEARLRSIRDLEDAGYLPRSTRLFAREIEGSSDESLPRFDIADAEMASGIFRDIEQAIQAPGDEVKKSWGPYLIHRDYETSTRLNAYLDGGGRAFLVRFHGRTYRLEIR